MLRPDIPFARDDANRFLPWMIALMAVITGLMLCLGATLGQWVAHQRGGAQQNFSVQIPQAADGEKALALVERAEGVKRARLVPPAEVRALVEPWLGSGEALKDIGFPALIDVDMAAPGAVDLPALQAKLADALPGASLDAQELWVEKFARFNHALQAAMAALAACILAALAGMMIFVARASMKLHASTVRLLHAIGADDGYIARQFQANAVNLALRGAVPGVVASAAAYGALGLYIARLDAPMLPPLGFSLTHVLLLAALPVACGVIALLSVRYATLGQLGKLP